MRSQVKETDHISELQIIDAVVTRGDTALFDPISFRCLSGQIIHLVGENGVGKTTLMRSICGFRSISSGQVLWNGTSIYGNDGFYLNSAYLGHRDAHSPLQSAWESLHFYQRLYNPAADPKEIDPLLNHLGLLAQADVAVEHLSFGQKRKLAIARLLLSERQLWLLDEPFSGVDRAGQKLIESICLQHILSNGMMLITNHGSLKNTALLDGITEVELR